MENVQRSPASSNQARSGRIDWVDYAKGFCIILVVMMHSTLRMGETVGGEGWLHWVVEFARPFRMPDFFLISGLFLANVIDRDWRLFIDRKVVHFFYFYLLWVAIQFVFKAPFSLSSGHTIEHVVGSYFLTFVQPFGTLWFIYLLPVFFVITKLLRVLPWYLLLFAAAALQIMPVHTGWVTLDELASRYVYFVAGYLFASHIFRLAAWAMANPVPSVFGLLIWGLANGALVSAGYSAMPFVSLALGAVGAGAVVLASCLLSRLNAMRFLRYLGKHSIIVYLAFFLPMGVVRLVLARYGTGLDIGTMSAIVTVMAVFVPVVMYKFVQITGLGKFLFTRPNWAYIAGKPVTAQSIKHSPQPAE